MVNRLVELAIEALEARKAVIEKEIKALGAGFRTGLKILGIKEYTRKTRNTRRKASSGKRSVKSAAARKAQSLRMKEYWAKRKAEASGRNKDQNKIKRVSGSQRRKD